MVVQVVRQPHASLSIEGIFRMVHVVVSHKLAVHLKWALFMGRECLKTGHASPSGLGSISRSGARFAKCLPCPQLDSWTASARRLF